MPFARTLLDAKAIAYSAGGLSGNAFGMSLTNSSASPTQVKAKAKNGSPAAKLVARGEADIAVQQISELIPVEGAQLVGALPPELDQVTQFSMGVLSRRKIARCRRCAARLSANARGAIGDEGQGADAGLNDPAATRLATYCTISFRSSITGFTLETCSLNILRISS